MTSHHRTRILLNFLTYEENLFSFYTARGDDEWSRFIKGDIEVWRSL